MSAPARARLAAIVVARATFAAPGVLPTAAVAIALTTAAAGAAPATMVAAQPPTSIAAHKASYDLTLDQVTGGSTVAASGSMTFQVTDVCTGWATTQQLHLQVVTREGQSTDMVSDYATLESKDGHHLTFDMRERTNGQVTQQVRGEASTGADGRGSIRFTLPARSTMALPAGTLFPMAHTEAIIRAAMEGKKSIDPVLFDGTSADGPSDSYVSILGWHPAPSDTGEAALRSLGSGRVHVSFFARKPGTVSPDYEIGMRYFANGVSDRLEMDFGDFRMKGTMRTFMPARPARC
ncbi:cell envelope integrity EipB family protein [Rhizosaccharibacter radicis]|uniref:Cell envelope integrity EipB family protein n=1 Tax=Rhizosaccharibacter radicis TaxID=2782605 RepID=A0ABT1VWQ9_9PROT|nr:cell envelope integrity EipB family protein [Acetobacteraceae bacterium KSS12]